jgi:hypothetical protein
MEPNATQQEILLHIETQFAHRKWRDQNPESTSSLSARQELEKACWDGLVKELIPELDIKLLEGRKLWLWQIHETQSFLALDFYEVPGPKENIFSIDPYLFLVGIRNN